LPILRENRRRRFRSHRYLARFLEGPAGHGRAVRDRPAWLLDVDGTLVDSAYHHALCWFRAFRAHGLTIPMWRIHRHIGMGGDRLVPAVAGDEVAERLGRELRESCRAEVDRVIDEFQPLDGAHELVAELHGRGHTVVLASSAARRHLDRYIELLDVRDLVDGTTSADDVERSKPAPDIVSAALDAAGDGPAVMLGDATWDVVAAAGVGVPALCLLTGGYSESELREAGAVGVFESLPDVTEALSAGRLDRLAQAVVPATVEARLPDV
jgi:HAD superfamily hydrolase (TIGR01549 family)